MELVAFELEEKLPLFESFARVLEGYPFAAVPDNHAARAIVAGGDDPLEVAVLQRVILHLHGQPLVIHVVRRALWHGPGAEHALHLEAKVEVELAGGVLMDDEEPSGRGRNRPNGLR